MKKLFSHFLLTLAFGFISCSAIAQFSGDFAPANWSFSSTTPMGDGSVNTSGAPNSIILNGSDSGNGMGGYEEYSITIAVSGTISFSYNHDNMDIDDAHYVINGATTQITHSGSGSLSNIAVNSGDVFGFRVENYDDCCGRGVLTISDFVFTSLLPTWNGTGNWTDNPNWTNGSPGAADSAIVQSGTLTVNTDATVTDLTLANGTTLIVATGNTLTVTGEYNNNGGTFTVQTGGALIFEGELKQNGVTRMMIFGKYKVLSGGLRLGN